MKTSQEVYQETIAAMSLEEKRAIFPPKTMKNFVVRKSWYGRAQIIKFTPKPSKTNPKPQEVTYNHDIALDMMRPLLEIKNAWHKYGYWSQSTDMPMILRHRNLMDAEPEQPKAKTKPKAKAKAKK